MASAAERVYDIVRSKIVSGELGPGERLREETLAETIGVSRTPVREALRRLDADGLIVLEENRGAQVASWTEQDLEEIFGLRALLEGYGARLAAEAIDEVSVAALAKLADEMEGAAARGAVEQIADLNERFHGLILDASGNGRLREAVARLVETPLVHRTFKHYSREALQRSLEHHREMVAALRARDGAWAESVMRSHVYAGRAALLPRDGA